MTMGFGQEYQIFSPQTRPDWLWDTNQVLIQYLLRAVFLEVNLPRREAEHSPVSSVKLKKELINALTNSCAGRLILIANTSKICPAFRADFVTQSTSHTFDLTVLNFHSKVCSLINPLKTKRVYFIFKNPVRTAQ
jgi:hypothetical protein